jgi:hypothetical protein
LKTGDTVQVKQSDLAILKLGEQPVPVTFWLFATVQEVLADGAFVEIDHPGNIEHGRRKKVLGANLRTAQDVQALHDASPLAGLAELSYRETAHLPLINYRAALARMRPEAQAA